MNNAMNELTKLAKLSKSKEDKAPRYEIARFVWNDYCIGKHLYTVTVDLSDGDLSALLNPDEEDEEYKRYAMEFFELEGVDGVIVATNDKVGELQYHFGGWMVIKGLKGKRKEDLGIIRSLKPLRTTKKMKGVPEEQVIKTSKGNVSFGTAYSAGSHPRGYCWVNTDKAEEEATPLYETEAFNFNESFISRHLYTVTINLSKNELHSLLNPDEYGKISSMAFFELEGVDGVLVATKNAPDEYRDDFGGWLVIKGLKGKRKEDLGIIQSFKSFKEDKKHGGYDKGTNVSTSKGSVRFGTDSSDEYYPSGYCDVHFNT